MSDVVFDSIEKNAKISIGLNNTSTIIMGNTKSITSVSGNFSSELITVSNASFNNVSTNLLNVSTLNGYVPYSSNVTFSNISVNGPLYISLGNISTTNAITSLQNVSFDNTYTALNFSMPSGLMNISNASFNNVSIILLNVSNITTNSINNVSAGMNIGRNSSTINIGSSEKNISILSKSISIASPLTLGTLPNASTQIGYIIPGNISTSVLNPASVTIPVAGIWLFAYNITYNVNVSTTTTSWAFSQLSGTNVPANQLFPYSYINVNNGIATCGRVVVNATASTYTVSFYANSSTSCTVSAPYSYLQAVRIA
jgi:hypothetical protein